MEADNGKDYSDNDEDGDHDNDDGLNGVNGGWQRGNADMADEVQGEEVVTWPQQPQRLGREVKLWWRCMTRIAVCPEDAG